jgi:uncharacterized protein with NRDE domain
MCLILVAAGAHPHYPLIVAANRDESYSRPSTPAAFWADDPRIYAGRDLEQGGTWLGISRTGRFAAITNYRQGVPRTATARSRGELTRGFLSASASPESYLQEVQARADSYNGFSVIVGAIDGLWFYSNRGGGPQRIAPGVHGLSNHLLDEPWPKVQRGIAALETLLAATEREIIERLAAVLSERTPAPDHVLPSTGIALERERALSASFIAGRDYGTRASTIVLVSADGTALFREHTYGPAGKLIVETNERFAVDTPFSRARAAPTGA